MGFDGHLGDVGGTDPHLGEVGQRERACNVVKVGDRFGWTQISGDMVEGEVIEIDSNVIIVRDQLGKEHCYES